MCGIAGYLMSTARAAMAGRELESRAARMVATLKHRGPDDVGTWSDAAVGLSFGFQRLAIQDVSPTGHQPMHSASGRYTIVFNGEIYNFHDLRAELDGTPFCGSSDTEVLLAAVERWGLRAAVERCVGMFAFAIWDAHERRLHLVRDRAGEKPLYYGTAGGCFMFASEVRALRAHPAFDAEIDRNAVAAFLRYGYIPAPHSIYRGICKLMPGGMLTVTIRRDGSFDVPPPQAYWSLQERLQQGAVQPFEGDDQEAIGELDRLCLRSVRQQMIADVPLGAFLSGGVDSSLVVAAMQSQSPGPIKTFTIGFRDKAFDEAPQARRIAHHLGTDHTELYVTPHDAQQVIPQLARIYDEPFSDSSQIPTFIVARLARRAVTVSLSGDGGDELFGGYPRYQRAVKLWQAVAALPRSLRRPLGRAVQAALDGAGLANRGSCARIYAAAQLLAADRAGQCYQAVVSRWKKPSQAVLRANEPLDAFTDPGRAVCGGDFFRDIMATDALSYLPDDILVKVDRAAMAVSLESRAPLLDHRLMEFSLRLPHRFLVRDGQTKWLLRQLLYRYVPAELVAHGKQGFAVPLGNWLRGPLRDWAESMFDETRLRRDGFFQPLVVRRKWHEHCHGRRDRMPYVWSILMFNAWLDANAGPGVQRDIRKQAA
jgi:asparagine synthase (glutamine-hydrolysing)